MRRELFGSRLRRAIAHRGYSQTRFAAQIDVPLSSLNAAVNGTIPRPDRLEAICVGLGITPEALQGPDSLFEAALAGAPPPLVEEVKIVNWVEDFGVVTGPLVWSHLGRRGELLDEGAGLRSSKIPIPSVRRQIAGLPPGADVIQVNTSEPLMIRRDDRIVDAFFPGELLFVTDLAPEDGDLVIVSIDVDPDDELEDHEAGIARSRIMIYAPAQGARLLWPLDGNPRAVELADRDVTIAGTVIERRRYR